MNTDYMDSIFEDFFPGMFNFWNRSIPLSWNCTPQRKDALTSVANNGLKQILNRPHNLLAGKDKDGNTVYRIEVVYTPFTKKDINVDFMDDFLEVRVGLGWDEPVAAEDAEVKEDDKKVKDAEGEKEPVEKKVEKAEPATPEFKEIYHGISGKPFAFKLFLKNLLDWQCEEEIDREGIKAKAEDGILSITIPTKKKRLALPKTSAIAVE